MYVFPDVCFKAVWVLNIENSNWGNFTLEGFVNPFRVTQAVSSFKFLWDQTWTDFTLSRADKLLNAGDLMKVTVTRVKWKEHVSKLNFGELWWTLTCICACVTRNAQFPMEIHESWRSVLFHMHQRNFPQKRSRCIQVCRSAGVFSRSGCLLSFSLLLNVGFCYSSEQLLCISAVYMPVLNMLNS